MRQVVVKIDRDKTNICKPGRHSAELINLMGLGEREEALLSSMYSRCYRSSPCPSNKNNRIVAWYEMKRGLIHARVTCAAQSREL